MVVSNRNLLFQGSIFRGYVGFTGVPETNRKKNKKQIPRDSTRPIHSMLGWPETRHRWKDPMSDLKIPMDGTKISTRKPPKVCMAIQSPNLKLHRKYQVKLLFKGWKNHLLYFRILFFLLIHKCQVHPTSKSAPNFQIVRSKSATHRWGSNSKGPCRCLYWWTPTTIALRALFRTHDGAVIFLAISIGFLVCFLGNLPKTSSFFKKKMRRFLHLLRYRHPSFLALIFFGWGNLCKSLHSLVDGFIPSEKY